MRRVTSAERAIIARQANGAAQAAAYLQITEGAIPWTVPQRIPDRPPVPTLPADLLPESLRGWLTDAAERMAVPLEFVAVPALVALGSVVGSSLAIRPSKADDWSVFANVWGGIVGGPGSMKSAAIDEAVRPVRALETAEREAFQETSAGRAADCDVREAALKAAREALASASKRGDSANVDSSRLRIQELALETDAAEKRARRYVTSDATVEKIGDLINSAAPRGLLVFRDELTGWVKAFDKPDRAGDRAFFLEAWNGGGAYTVDRIGRGTLAIPRLCLSLCGGVQPGPLSKLVDGALGTGEAADGLLQRFGLLVWPDQLGEWKAVDRMPDRAGRDRASRVFHRLAYAEPVSLGAIVDDGIAYVRFAPDAQVLWDAWRTDLEGRVRGFELEKTPALCAHITKYRKVAPALALLGHLADVADDAASSATVGLAALQRALGLVEFLELHARRIYRCEGPGNVLAARALAERITSGAIADGMTVRDLKQREWSGLHGSAVYDAIEFLEGLGWVRLETVATGGRPSDRLFLNPALIGRRPR